MTATPSTLPSTYERLTKHAREVALLKSTQSLLEWDERTKMPPAGGDYRVQDDHGATDRPEEFSPENRAVAMDVARIAERVLELDRPLLYARVDFLEDSAGSLWLTELELVEPSLFFRHHRPGATALARAFLRRLRAA